MRMWMWMWGRIKSGLRQGWVLLLSCAWLVPLAMAGDRVLVYLNNDLARLYTQSAPAAGVPPTLLDINESPNITAARLLLLVSAGLLALALSYWVRRVHRRLAAQPSTGGAAPASVQQLQSLAADWHQGHAQLLGLCARLAEGAGPASARSADAWRQERLAVLLDQRLGEVDRRLVAVEVALRTSGEQMAHQFVDLRDRVVQRQSVNSSQFGDLASAPMPLGAVIGDNARLRDIVLNLTHLQEDLRLERRQLRRRLQSLPEEAAVPATSSRP
jgi:hypothetical protein